VGTITLIRSTVSDNYAQAGVGGINLYAATLRSHNSTVSGNRVGCYCYRCPVPPVPGIGSFGGSLVELSYSTIADNECAEDFLASAQIVTDSIVAAKGSVFSSQAGWNCSSSVSVSRGYNLDSDGSCGFVDPTDQSGIDPLLGPLQDNGGSTPTHALLPGSPALNAIPTAACTWDDDADPLTPEVPLLTDQRGIDRPQGSGCDIGAFERVPPPPGPSCGMGPELALLLPLVGWARRRRRRSA
jgi:hypothetical protein